jgi:hypothetical protein
MLKKKICTGLKRIIELFTQKFVTNLSKIWVWDPGSEKPIPDPGIGLGGLGTLKEFSDLLSAALQFLMNATANANIVFVEQDCTWI